MYAVLTPNINTPATPSNAPISCQCWCSVNPEAPRVVIESIEKSIVGGCIECAQQEIGFRPQGGLDPMQESKRQPDRPDQHRQDSNRLPQMKALPLEVSPNSQA